MKIRKKNENGFALFQALLIIYITSLLVIIAAEHVRLHSLRNHHRGESILAGVIAETGIQDIIYRLKETPNLRFDGSDTYPALVRRYDKFEYKVVGQYERMPDLIKITSTGMHGKKKGKKAKKDINVEINSLDLFQIVAREGIRIGRDVEVKGNIYSGSRIESDNFSRIEGSMISHGYINVGGEHKGEIYPNTKNKKKFDIPTFKNLLPKKHVQFVENILKDRKFSNIVLYHRGSLYLENCEFDNVSIFVDGKLEITGNFQIKNFKEKPAIYATGDIKINLNPVSESKISGWIISDDKLQMKGAIEHLGKLMAEQIALSGKIRTTQETVDIQQSPELITRLIVF